MKVDIRVAWGEMDAYGHVNNAVFLRWFESARVDWLRAVQFPDDGKIGPVLAKATVEYLLPVKHPDDVEIVLRPTRIGTSSVTLAYEVTSRAQGALVAKGETVVVLIDLSAGRSVALDADARARIEADPSWQR